MTWDEIADWALAEFDRQFPGGNHDVPEFYDGVSVGVRFVLKHLERGSIGFPMQASSD